MKQHMDYQVVLETDLETGHVTGTVVGIPEIIVDAMDEEQALKDLRQAIQLALDDPVLGARKALAVRVSSVEV